MSRDESFEHLLGGGPTEPTPLGPVPDSDPVAAALRQALQAEALQVQPSPDGLLHIREAIGAGVSGGDRRVVWLAGGGPGRRWAPVLAAAAVLVAATAAGLVALGGPDDADHTAQPGPAAPTAVASTTGPSPERTATYSPHPTQSATQQPAPVSPTDAASGPGLPVYYPGVQGTRIALFREFHATTLSEPAARLQEAVTQALTRRPTDPDYSLPWAPGSAATTSWTPELITVDLNAAAAGTGLGSETATVAVQQLVFTATAAVGSTAPVAITVQGKAVDLFGVLSGAQPFTRGTGADDPRAAVWISSLGQGQSVPRGSLHVSGDGVNVFENTLSWTLTRDGVQVGTGPLMPTALGGGVLDTGQRGVWALDFSVTQPGSYELSVEVPDASNGEGSVVWKDTKGFVVR